MLRNTRVQMYPCAYVYWSDIEPLELIWKVDSNVIPSLVRLAPNHVT